MENLRVINSRVLVEHDTTPPEQKLWRAVLNQALEDAFGVNTIHICDRDKHEVNEFFRNRTEAFDQLCDDAGIDPTNLWRKVQRLKGVQSGFLTPLKREKNVLSMFASFKERREQYRKTHWRNNYVG